MRHVPVLLALAACGAPPDPTPPICPDPAGAPIDALPVARLDADATAPTILKWVDEAEDAVATVRDPDPTTGWLPDPTRVSTLTIDLGPYAGRPVWLDTLTLEFLPGALPTAIEVRRLDACGGAVLAREDLVPAASVALALDGCGACVEVAVTAVDGTRLVGATLTARDPVVAPPAEPAPIALGDRHPALGVVEGFYGPPWSFLERRRLVDMLGAHGMGTYLYAPKDDPLHRAAWRDPYDPAFLSEFADLARWGAARKVDVVFGMSPFLDLDPGSSADVDALTAKLGAFVDAGVPGVAIFADDIELEGGVTVDAALGDAQVAVVNEVVRRLAVTTPDLTVWFVGTVYSNARLAGFPEGDAYLESLAGLDPTVHVMWTGTDTFSPTLSPGDLDDAATQVGRPLSLWDNAWANDAGDGLTGRILLGPWSGRSPDLLEVLDGGVMNPSIQGGLSRLSVGTFAAWVARADEGLIAEDARAQRLAAATAELRYTAGAAASSDRDTLLLLRVMESFDGSGTQIPTHRALSADAETVAEALLAGALPDPTPLTALAQRAAGLSVLHTSVHHSGIAPELVDELDLPLRKVAALAEVVTAALELVARRAAGEPDGDATLRLEEAAARLPASARFLVDTEAVDRLTTAALIFSPSVPVAAPERTGEPPTTCTVGTQMVWAPFSGIDTLYVDGLPGADVVGTTVRWTPRWPGRFEAVAVGTGAVPRIVRTTLVCAP